MTGPVISNRSMLQPSTQFHEINLDTGEKGKPSVGFDSGGVGLGERRIEPSRPQGVHGTVGGHDGGGVRSLSELNLQSAPPAQTGKRLGESVSVLNAMINSIERMRSDNGGTLPPMGQTLRQHLDLLTDAFELLNSGPTVGDALMNQMEDLDGVAEALRQHLEAHGDSMPPEVREEVMALTENVLAQIEDRVSYLGHTVNDSPLSSSKMYESKAQMSEAAVRVIEQALARDDLTTEQRQKLESARDDIFKARAQQLLGEARDHQGELGNPKEIVGKKPMGFLQRLFSPFKAGAQKEALNSHVDQLMKGGTSSNTSKIDEQTVIESTLARVFKEAGLSSKHVGHELHHAMNEVLNDQQWKPIVKEIQLQSGTETVFAYSETTPAGNFIDSYGGKGFNAHSILEHEHTVNLAQTKLTDGQGQVLFSGMRHGVISAFGIVPKEVAKMSDEEVGKLVQDLLPKEMWVREGEGARRLMQSLDKSGIGTGGELPPLGEPSLKETIEAVRSNPELVHAMRRVANENRAQEIVLANLLTDEALLRAALSGETVNMDILSISLLTPDHLRKGTNSNEQMMVGDQMQAWKDVAGERTLMVKHPDTGEMVEVRVNVNPISCNYGVNQGAVKGVGPISSSVSLISGWDDMAGINGEAVAQLLGEDVDGVAGGGMPGGLIGERMQRLEESILRDRETLETIRDTGTQEEIARLESSIRAGETKLQQARELARQIGEIQQDGSFKVAGGEPYKMPTRLAVLSEMFGIKVAFNCKSGKDRTGELDAEIKHFKLQMELTGKVPEHTRARSPQEISHLHEVLTHSGNFEMQRLNTGYAGYKLKGVPELYSQFGGVKGDEVTDNFLGLSGYTAS